MKSFFAKYKAIIIILLVVIAGGGAYWYVTSNQAPSFGSMTATRGNVVASLDEPGTVLTENSAVLSFQTPGEITSLNVQEGQAVSAGTVLASLDTSALTAAVSQANAGVATAQANLNQLESGTRPEQLAINETAVMNASTSLGATLGSAYAAADDAVQNQSDNLFTSPNTNNPVFIVPAANSQTIINIENQRVAIGTALAAWYSATNATSSASQPLTTIAASTLQQIASYLNTIALAVNSATPNSNVSAAQLAAFKVNVTTARTEVNAAITALTTADAALQNAQDQLALAEAGATSQQVAAQQAVVLQAQAGVASAQVALQHAELVAPFSGTVQNLTATVGQVVSPGVSMLSLINNSGLKVQTYVSEADVAKIKNGDAANVTLDAFGTSTNFPATITTIATDQTQVDGTPAYEVELHFTNPDSRIRDGMTGSVHIVLGEDDNVVTVPSRLVINDGNNYFVLVQQGNQSVKTPVQIGLVGDNGTTEITSGINAGDTLTNF